MHPLVPAVIGGIVAAIAYAVVTRGVTESYERIAFAAGVVALILGGVGLVLAGVPAVDVKRGLATGASGLSVFFIGVNVAIGAQTGSGGFSSARTNSMIALAVFAIVLALCLPLVKPAA